MSGDPVKPGGNPAAPPESKVTEMIAYCGLSCQACPISLATRQENKRLQARMRFKIAQFCKELYGKDFQPADNSDCDGCQAGGRLFSECYNCPIRNCASEKKLENCAYCPEYACAKLETFFRTDPIARTHLDAIRTNLL